MGFELPPNTPLTPMLEQYVEIKRRYPDAILLYRMGDFYEMFFDDALTAAPVCEVQLTSRDRNSENPIPMCGVPHHSVMPYIAKLLAKGFRVAICEQMEDPALAKGLVKRDVARVMTPSMVGDPELVPEETTNWLAAIALHDDGKIEVSLLNLLGGELRAGTVASDSQLKDLFYELMPREVLIARDYPKVKWFEDLFRIFPHILITKRPNYFGSTIDALKAYFKETQKLDVLPFLEKPGPLLEAKAMELDATTLHSLEVLRNFSGVETATLLHILDETRTPMGRRTLKHWLAHPLASLKPIKERQEAIAQFLAEPVIADGTEESLRKVRDLERLATKTALGLSHPRDLVSIREILRVIPPIAKSIGCTRSALLKKIAKELDPLTPLLKKLDAALLDEPSLTIRDGNIFRSEFHPELGTLRTLSLDGKSTIAELEARERAATGISSLKLKYSRVFGYTIEVTKSQVAKVPKKYIRKQTIANGERYITEELKALEEKILSADQKLRSLEESLFLELRHEVGRHAQRLLKNAKLLGDLDVLLGLSVVAKSRGYRRPTLHEGWELEIKGGRHPVIESMLPIGKFIPNDVSFDEESRRTWIITGPNMGGKSTIMRQVALLSLMAQTGSFLPVEEARLPLLDAIHTRIGSSDDLARGRSTFMVEMSEVSRILTRATDKSLVIIDEIGRGTSTYDGLALAWSLLEHIHEQIHCKTLFATHFHELTQLEKKFRGVRNANVLVERDREDIVFLYKLAEGACLQSLGIHVARLAGLPVSVLDRSREILGLLEAHSERASRSRSRALETGDNQLAFFPDPISSETQTGLDSH